ncbi:MAG: hypothetical protein MJ249_05330 [Kiritimatiellae bacterium]|nr:hypothetical protein [Kiritimatiellia bacterium]
MKGSHYKRWALVLLWVAFFLQQGTLIESSFKTEKREGEDGFGLEHRADQFKIESNL